MMRRLLIGLIAAVAVLLVVQFWGFWEGNDRTRQFRAAIAGADEVRIRCGGFDCCNPVDDQKVLCRITEPAAIRALSENLRFEADPDFNCMCCGYPGIDWYRNGKRIVLASVQHGKRLRWKGWKFDSTFTPRTREWLATWFKELGVLYPHPPPLPDTPQLDNLDEYIKPRVNELYVELPLGRPSLSVKDYSALAQLKRVKQLVLMSCDIEDLKPLEGLTTLEELTIFDTRVRDISPLAELQVLRTLDLSCSPVADISPLAGLERLEFLDLQSTRVTDMAPIAHLPALGQLLISYDEGMDLRPLSRMKALWHLSVRGVSEESERGQELSRKLRALLPECDFCFQLEE